MYFTLEYTLLFIDLFFKEKVEASTVDLTHAAEEDA